MTTKNPEMVKEKPRMSRGFINRLIAILVFVALGTYAVFQTIPRKQVALHESTGDETPATQPLIPEGESIQPAGHIQTEPTESPQGSATPGDDSASALSSSFPSMTPSSLPTTSARTSVPPGNSPPDNAPSAFAPGPASPSSSLGVAPPASRSFGSDPATDTERAPITRESPPTDRPLLGPSTLNAQPTSQPLDRPQVGADDPRPTTVEGQEMSGSLPPLRRPTLEQTGDASQAPQLTSPPAWGGFGRPSSEAPDAAPPDDSPAPPAARPSTFGGWGGPEPAASAPPTLADPTRDDQTPNPMVRNDRPAELTVRQPESSAMAPLTRPNDTAQQHESPATPPRSFGDSPRSFDSPSETNPRPMVTGLSPGPQPQSDQNAAAASDSPPRIERLAPPTAPVVHSRPFETTESAPPARALTQPRPGDRQLEGAQTPSLSIEKIAPPEIQVNQSARFQLVVRNVGRVAAEEVVVDDQIPESTEFVASTPQPKHRGGSGQIQWHLGTLQPGEERTIDFELRPTRPGEIGSVAQVSFATKASMRTTVTQPILSIEHSVPSKVLIGDKVTLDITVRNGGTGAARNVIIQESVPQALSYSDQFRDLEYSVGTLAPGQSQRIQLTLQAVQVGRVLNTIQAVAEGLPPVQHSAEIEVIAPNLQVSSDGPQRRFLKRDAAFQFTVVNRGTAPATNVDLVAKLPRGLRFANANNQGQYDSGSHAVYWSLAQLIPEQQATVEVQLLPGETGAQDIEFLATADLSQKDALLHKLVVEHLVDVHFEIDDVDDHIEVGSQTDYRIRVINQGTKAASNVRLNVSLEAGMRPIKTNGGLTAEIRGQQVLFPSIANLNPGEEIVLAITAQGMSPGDHRVSANLQADGREIDITKEESTRVYADR